MLFLTLTFITAFLLPIPKNPVLPFSIISYSSLSLVVPSFTDASVKASSTVFADTSIYSTFLSPYLRELRSLKSFTMFAFEARLPAFAFDFMLCAFASLSSLSADADMFAFASIDFVLIFAACLI